MMFVNELFDILKKEKDKFYKKVCNCYFKNEHGELTPFDYVEFLKDGTLIVSQSPDDEDTPDKKEKSKKSKCSVCKNKRFVIIEDNPVPCKKCNSDKKFKLKEVTRCLGCGKPYTEIDAELLGVPYRDCGCPAGTCKTLLVQEEK
jgi:hypothetical protein